MILVFGLQKQSAGSLRPYPQAEESACWLNGRQDDVTISVVVEIP
jgi:hypothetical protein